VKLLLLIRHQVTNLVYSRHVNG